MRIKSQRLSLTRREARVNNFTANNLAAWMLLPVRVEGSPDPIALYPDTVDDGRNIPSGIEVILPDSFIYIRPFPRSV
jgi:hypothetical protein